MSNTLYRFVAKFNKWLLRQELKRSNGFTISGYKDRMVRIIGVRFLDEWEVDYVHELKSQGRITPCGEWSVTSPHGQTYKDTLYTLIPKQ